MNVQFTKKKIYIYILLESLQYNKINISKIKIITFNIRYIFFISNHPPSKINKINKKYYDLKVPTSISISSCKKNRLINLNKINVFHHLLKIVSLTLINQ